MNPEIILILAGLVLLSLILSVRICKDTERVMVTNRGNFKGLRGPGLYLIMPHNVSTATYTKVRVNDTGVNIGNGWAEINGVNVPITPAEGLNTDEKIMVRAFINQEIYVVKDQ